MANFLNTGDVMSPNDYQSFFGYGNSPKENNLGGLFDMSSPGASSMWDSAYQSPVVGGAPANSLSNLWGALGSTDAKTNIKTDGWGGMALGTLQGLGSAYMGMQQLKLGKASLENNKQQYERNYAAQRKTTNASLEDRQRARIASNPGAYQSVGEYMNKNGIA